MQVRLGDRARLARTGRRSADQIERRKVAEVNTFMNKFGQMQQMMKKFGKMQKMMGRMGGKMPGMR
jgi:signal recognition particle GTPase